MIKQLIVVEHCVLFDCFASLAMNGLPRDFVARNDGEGSESRYIRLNQLAMT
jgi:hypothetical protein